MCGIVGAIGHEEAAHIVRFLLQAIQHRGPDGSGSIADLDRSLGMCRLRIRGTHSISLPISTTYGAIGGGWASYNGEVYTTVSLDGGQIVPEGAVEEVGAILRSLQDHQQIDGMYALSWTPADFQEVSLYRDPFGIKPLYWRQLDHGYAFASEASALAAIAPGVKTIPIETVWEYLAFGKPLGQNTFYSGVSSVPLGGSVRLTRQDAVVTPASLSPLRPQAGHIGVSDVRAAVKQSAEQCIVSDRHLGIALSGGLDSTILAYELDALGVEHITTISVCIPGVTDGLEDLRALGLPEGGAWITWDHHTVTLSPEDFPGMLRLGVAAFGQPTRMTSVPLYTALAQKARELGVVVLLSGEGADELFGGYSSYLTWQKGAPSIPGLEHLRAFAFPSHRRTWISQLLGPEAVDWCDLRFEEIYGNLAEVEPLSALRQLELSLHLEPLLLRTDHCLMRYGIEGRTPYLHGNVPQTAATLTEKDVLRQGQTKAILRAGWRKELATQTAAAKHAFRLPIDAWLSSSLATWASTFLREGKQALEGWGCNRDIVESLIQGIQAGDMEAASLGYSLLTLLTWTGLLESSPSPTRGQQADRFV